MRVDKKFLWPRYTYDLMKWRLTTVFFCAVAVGVPDKPDKGSTQHESGPSEHGQTSVTFNNYEKPATETETTKASTPKWYTTLEQALGTTTAMKVTDCPV